LKDHTWAMCAHVLSYVYTSTSLKGAGYTIILLLTETVVSWNHPNRYCGIAILWLMCVDCGGNENILQKYIHECS